MVYRRTEHPPWSWSHSRRQTFESCLRRYYYQYYASHNGWEWDAAPLASLAYRLKQLSNMYTSLGDVVHKTAELLIEQVLANSRPWSAEKINEHIRQRMNAVFLSSRSNRQAFIAKPKHNPMLHEFYYDQGPSQELIQKIAERIDRVSDNLPNSCTLEELQQTDVAIKQYEEFDTFPIGDTPVYAVPDLVYAKPNGSWIIVDWKTGDSSEENITQVKLYSLYVVEKFGINLQDVVCRLEYLNSGEHREYCFSSADMESVYQQVKMSIKAMRQYLLDVKKNIPKDVAHFPLTNQYYQCRMCNFYQLCKEELEEGVKHSEQSEGVS